MHFKFPYADFPTSKCFNSVTSFHSAILVSRTMNIQCAIERLISDISITVV